MQQRQRDRRYCHVMRSRDVNHRLEESISTRRRDVLSQTKNEKKETENSIRNSSDKQPVNHQLLNDYKACLRHHGSLAPLVPTSLHLPLVKAISDVGMKMSVSQGLRQSEVASELRHVIHVCRAVFLLLKRVSKTHLNKRQPPTILQAFSAHSIRIKLSQARTQLDLGWTSQEGNLSFQRISPQARTLMCLGLLPTVLLLPTPFRTRTISKSTTASWSLKPPSSS